ncbi:hypothetical protein [Burkholderia anthina]|nr:hypothetical protein [Burkholderia anthina]WJN72063.1 hypothetical protein OH687_38685 [Burkholderia anthina]
MPSFFPPHFPVPLTLLNQADALSRGFVEQAFPRLSQASKNPQSNWRNP